MRALLLPLMLVAVLSACGEARTNAGEAVAAEPAFTGQFKASSETAKQATGDVGVERAGLIFASGATLYTRTLEPRRGGDLAMRDGESYAALAVGSSELRVELRRVVDVADAEEICAGARPTYIALVHEERRASFTLLVFTGADPPGAEASDTRMCASYAYTAPHGARTREGVVLW